MTSRQIGGSIRRVETASGPRWRFRVDIGVDPESGRRRQRTYTFKSEAEAVAEQTKTRGQVATASYVDRDRVTVSEYLDGWLVAGRRAWRPSTHRSYVLALKPAHDEFGKRRLQSLTRRDIDVLATRMLEEGGRGGKGRSPRTVALFLTILSKALKDAVVDDLLVRNPCEHVRKPSVPHHEMTTWSAKQAARFLAHTAGHRLAGPLALTMRGLRRGEVLGLQWGDVDFKKGTVTIRRTRTQAGKDGVVVGPPKTTRGRRTLPLDPALVAALKATRKATRVQRIGAAGESWVVVDEHGDPMRPEAYGDMFLALAAEAGLPRIRLHDARHTALTLLLEAGHPPHVVAKFAGHDPSVTLRTYAHVNNDALSAASATFGALYGL